MKIKMKAISGQPVTVECSALEIEGDLVKLVRITKDYPFLKPFRKYMEVDKTFNYDILIDANQFFSLLISISER